MRWRGPIILGLILSLLAPATVPVVVRAANGIHGSPPVINLYLGWQLRNEDLVKLAKWDVVVLDADQQARYPNRLRKLRELNPSIKLLAYVPSEEIASARFTEPVNYPFAKMASQIQDAWYVRGTRGNRAEFWPGSALLNVTNEGPAGPTGERWNEFLPRFIHQDILSSGLWDGIFLDNTFSGISYFARSPVDLDRNGIADTKTAENAAWRAGMKKMLRTIHADDPKAIIMGNGGAVYASDLNGAFFEHFPSWSWGPNWKEFRNAVTKSRSPNLTGLNVNTDNYDRQNDYQLMRYGLTSALVGGGWYSFDRGDWGHDVLWWYDEYNTALGASRSAPRLIQGAKRSGVGVWGRDFAHGLALVNSTDAKQHVRLSGVYEKIRGSQDPSINTGALVTSVELQPHDGVLLLRQSSPQEIQNASFINGSFMHVYDGTGKQKQNGFFAQLTDAPSGAEVELADLDRDGRNDLVIAKNGIITIHYSNGKRRSFHPFGLKYTGEMFIAIQNTNRDPALEIVVGRVGTPPEVRVFSAYGKLLAHWSAYNPAFAGGVHVAIGDLNGDGLREIVTGAGPSGGPHIRIWKTDGKVWGGSFFAFPSSETGGVSVAVGDVDGDGKDEIIAGSGAGTIPRVRIFDFRGTMKAEITLGTKPLPFGIHVAASDINGDGRAEILVSGLSAF